MKAFRWEEYKNFFQITIFKYLVMWFSVVPVIAVIFEQIPSPIEVKLGANSFVVFLKLPFNWQILWISSFFFVIALIIYFILCPKFIKKYNTFKDYQSYSHDARWMAWEASILWKNASVPQKDKLISRLKKKKFIKKTQKNENEIYSSDPSVEQNQTVFYFTHQNNSYKLAMPVFDDNGDVIEDSEKGVFYELFGRYSESSAFGRGFILLLLCLSGIAFLSVLGQHIWSGASFVWQWIMSI